MERNTTPRSVAPQKHLANIARLQEIGFVCLAQWKWFVLSAIISFAAAAYYLASTPKTHTYATSLLIKVQNNSNKADNQLAELGIDNVSPNVQNELLALTTLSAAREVVDRLRLNVAYAHQGALKEEVLWGAALPATVAFRDLADNETASLTLRLTGGQTATLSDFRRAGQDIPGSLTVRLGRETPTPLGRITVRATPYTRPAAQTLLVSRTGREAAAGRVKSAVRAALRDKQATVIDITYTDVCPARAAAVLDALVAVYNENWVKDRNQISISTNDFIKDRLGVIERELGSVEQDISSYKSERLMPDVAAVGSLALQQASAAEATQRDISAQLYMARYIRQGLSDDRHNDRQLPAGSGIANQQIQKQINDYNDLMLQRNNHLAISSLQNPLVVDLDQRLLMLRHAIGTSLDNEITMLEKRRQQTAASQGSADAKLAANPQQAKYLLSVERQQKVKESLYLFLLQKREENELSQAFTAYNTRQIEPPHPAGPLTPNAAKVMLIALLVALGVPGAVIFAHESANMVVRGRKDLEQMQTPFIGEIPLDVSTNKRFEQYRIHRRRAAKKGKHLPAPKPELLVKADGRDVMNEAFRMVRANLEFMLGSEAEHRVVMFTSINPGSGKTFCAANLAEVLAVKGKRVLAIDLDMRRGTLSRYADKPHAGVANYLGGHRDRWQELVVPCAGADMLPCGTIPPNPTELLYSDRLAALIREAREQYDYVLIDCPPVEMVADSAIISQHTDLTIFLIRAGLLDSGFLDDIERMYHEKKYGNLAVLLNATTDAFSHYGYHKYGYRHGYHYGYHYDYMER